MPVYLAGRDEDIKNIENLFDGLMLNIPTQSVIFSGLRGVGKTVLINRLQTIAEEKGIFCRHIEVEERNDFISQIASCSQAFLRKISTVEKFKHLIQKPLDAIKALVVSFDPGENTFSLSVQERELYTTVNLTQSLTDVFCTIGEAAGKAETPICFFIDEIQYMKSNELGSTDCGASPGQSAGLSGNDRGSRTSEDLFHAFRGEILFGEIICLQRNWLIGRNTGERGN